MTISVIIPAYNVAAYLPKALDSVLGQSFVDWQVVLVNDGSTDGTLDVARRYSVADSRIKVIDQPNAGVMAARRTGLSHAVGELICFLDGDDFMTPHALERLYGSLSLSGADVVIGNYYRHSASYTLERREGCLESDLQGDGYVKAILTNEVSSFLWGRLYRAEVLRGVDLPLELNLSEDKYINLQVALRGVKVALCSDFIVYYVKRTDSMTHYVMPLEYVKLLTGCIERLFTHRLDLMPWVVMMKVSYYLTYINSTSGVDISCDPWVRQLHQTLNQGENRALYRKSYGPWDRINVTLRRTKAGALPAKILLTVHRISKSISKRVRKYA